MENPWTELPEAPPFVLSDEHDPIRLFNNKTKDIQKIRLELIPEPYLGTPSSPIVLLNLNPGFMEEEIVFHLSDPHFISESRKTLLHLEQEYPFYLLDPELSNSEGHKWWMKKLRRPCEIGGVRRVSRSIFCLEYFPYHSARFKPMKRILRSQRYSWFLASEAIRREAVIIMMRGKRFWYDAMPGLESYPRLYHLRNVQNVTISPGNCPEVWPMIEDILRA